MSLNEGGLAIYRAKQSLKVHPVGISTATSLIATLHFLTALSFWICIAKAQG